MSALLAAGILIGCGATGDPGGGSEPVAEKVEAPEVVSTETAPDVTADTKDEDTKDEDTKDAEADVGAENILEREKPVIKDAYNTDEHYPTNKFIMIEEVVGEPEEGYGDSLSHCYVKIKGTLYEVYLDGVPDYDLVYYPGDELPEGYEVKVTENYETRFSDAKGFGEGHQDILGNAYLAEEEAGVVSYKLHMDGCLFDCDLDPSIPPEESYAVKPALEPGMYGSLNEYAPTEFFHETFIQYLLKDQIPEGVELADNVAHQ